MNVCLLNTFTMLMVKPQEKFPRARRKKGLSARGTEAVWLAHRCPGTGHGLRHLEVDFQCHGEEDAALSLQKVGSWDPDP